MLAKRSLGPGHREVPHQRRPSAIRADVGVGGRVDATTRPRCYYHQMRGMVTGTKPGDTVEVWFEGGGQRSDSFTYDAVSESGNRVLVVAAEDYTGASPVQTAWTALRRSTTQTRWPPTGSGADVYDIDAPGGSRRTRSACSATTTR